MYFFRNPRSHPLSEEVSNKRCSSSITDKTCGKYIKVTSQSSCTVIDARNFVDNGDLRRNRSWVQLQGVDSQDSAFRLNKPLPRPCSGCHPQTLDPSEFAPDVDRDQRRKAVQVMIENLQGRRGAITKLKAELRLLTARRSLPIPHELLEIIFQYLVHSYGQLPEKLLLVCRTFYLVAINCRALWTDLDPVFPSVLRNNLLPWAGTFIQSRVARSNPIPLDIDFTNLWDLEVTDEFAKKVAGIPTLLQRCRSIVISRSSELHFFQGFQPLLESLSLEIRDSGYHSPCTAWESVGECPNLRSLKLGTPCGRKNWPEHLFQQLTQLEIKMPLRKGNNPPCYHRILPVARRLRSLTITVDYCGGTQPVIHQSLQTLVLVYRLLWVVQSANTLGEIVCPALRRLEIQALFRGLFSPIQLRHTQKLSELCLDCRQGIVFEHEEEDGLLLSERWSGCIVELLRSIGTIKHLELRSMIQVVSGVVEKLEADPTLCPDLISLHAELYPSVPTAHSSRREGSLLLELQARISERYQRLRRE